MMNKNVFGNVLSMFDTKGLLKLRECSAELADEVPKSIKNLKISLRGCGKKPPKSILRLITRPSKLELTGINGTEHRFKKLISVLSNITSSPKKIYLICYLLNKLKLHYY